jgi:hypothetical protein
MTPLQVSLNQAEEIAEKLERLRKMETPVIAKLLKEAMAREGKKESHLPVDLVGELNDHILGAACLVDGILKILREVKNKEFDIKIEF